LPGFVLCGVLFATSLVVSAQRRDVFVASRDEPAIRYSSTPATDAVAALNLKLQDGSATLTFDPSNGYLRSVLDALKVPVESQGLCFRKPVSGAAHQHPEPARGVLR
jgi:hypothetical protein